MECESAALQPHPCTLRPRGAPHPKRAPSEHPAPSSPARTAAAPRPHPACKASGAARPPGRLTIAAPRPKRNRWAGPRLGKSVIGARDPLAPTTSPAKWQKRKRRRAAMTSGGARSPRGPAPKAGVSRLGAVQPRRLEDCCCLCRVRCARAIATRTPNLWTEADFL